MTFISNIARRSICVAATRVPRAPMIPTLNYIRPAAAGFSTQTHAQVEAVEGMLANLHWADLKDNVHGLRDLMNEIKTNHALPRPDIEMEDKLAQEMEQIQDMFASPEGRRDEVSWRICRLKALMKEKMYYA
jgi:hypothetical protein